MLHVRVEAQLRCKEEMSGLRARAITFDKVHQPWRVFINTIQPTTGRPRSFLQQGPALRQLYSVGKRMMDDPTFITHPDWRFLDGYDDVKVHHEKWRDHRKQEPMLRYLYADVAEDDFVLLYLKAQGSAIMTQLERNSKDFLPGGRYFDPSPELQSAMVTAPGTSAGIEREFAIKDYVTRTSAPTMSFHSKSAKSAYVSNDTHTWMLTHEERMRLLIARRSRYHERRDWRESNRIQCRADKLKEEGAAVKFEAARKAIKAEIKRCITLEDKQPFLRVAEWDSFIKEQSGRKMVVDREIRSQVRLLITLYNKKKKNLMVFKGLSHEAMMASFRMLVSRIEAGEFDPLHRSTLLQRLQKDSHIFRGGTSSKVSDAVDAADKDWMKELVEEVKDDMDKAARAKTRGKGSRANKRTKTKSIIGRTVAMSKAIWGESADEVYYGIVVKARSIKYRGKMRRGYDIKWGPGDTENWGEDVVFASLIDDNVMHTLSDGRDLQFDANHYELVRRCEVEEVDHSWRVISLYRDKKYDNVVLWYSDVEWEGINTSGAAEGPGSGYRMKEDGSVFDTDGVAIRTRPIVSTNPNPTTGSTNIINPTPNPDTNPNPKLDVVDTDVVDVVDPEKIDYIDNMIDVNDTVNSSDSDWDLFE